MIETEPQLKKEYVDTGKVRMIFKHFPIPSHTHAELASIVAECAGAQGKFWEMNDRIFATQEEWAGLDDAHATFEKLAQEIGLDVKAYKTCLDDPKIKAEVEKDRSEGQSVGINGTPNFVVLKGESGQLIPGALPYDQFKKVLDAALAAP